MSPSDKNKTSESSISKEDQSKECPKSQKMDSSSELASSSISDVTIPGHGMIANIPLITASLPTLKCSANDQMKTFDPGEEGGIGRLTSNQNGNAAVQGKNHVSGSSLIKNNSKNYIAGSKINKLADMLAKRSQNVVEVTQNNTSDIITDIASVPKVEDAVILNNVSSIMDLERNLNSSLACFKKTANNTEVDVCRKSRRKSVPNQSCNVNQLQLQSTSKSCSDFSKLFPIDKISKLEFNALGGSLNKLQTDESTKKKAVRKNLKNVELPLILPKRKRRSVRNEHLVNSKVTEKILDDPTKSVGEKNKIRENRVISSKRTPKVSVNSTKKISKVKQKRSKKLVETSTQTTDIEFITMLKPEVMEKSLVEENEKSSFMYRCLYCTQTFSSGSQCKAHEKTHSQKNKQLIKCQYCSKKLPSFDDFKSHCIQKHPNKYAYCMKCNERFVTKEDLYLHNREIHLNKIGEIVSQNALVAEVQEKTKIDIEERLTDKKIMKQNSVKDLKIDVSYDSSKKSSVSPRNVQKVSPKETRTEEQLLEMEMLFYSNLSGNIQENLTNHLDGKMDKSGTPVRTDQIIQPIDSFQAKAKSGNSLSVDTPSAGVPDVQISRAPSPYQTRSKTPNPLPPTAKKFKKLPNWQQKFWEKYNFPTNYRFEHRFWDKNYLNTEKAAFYLKDLSCLDIKTQLTVRENIKKLDDIKIAEENSKLGEKLKFPDYLSLVSRSKNNAQEDEKELLKGGMDQSKNKKVVRKEETKKSFKAPELESPALKTRRKLSADNTPVKKQQDKTGTEGIKMLTRRQSSIDLLKDVKDEEGKKKEGNVKSGQRMSLRRQTSLDSFQEVKSEKNDEVLECNVNCSSVKSSPPSPIDSAEITGEWVRPRSYLCGTCCAKFTNLWELEDHKWVSHPNVWCTHYEFEDEKIDKLFERNENEEGSEPSTLSKLKLTDLYKRYLLPYGSLKTAKLVPNSNFPEQCTKCKKNCMSSSEMHKHMLDCGGDTTWFLTMYSSPMSIKRKWRPFGSRRRKQLGRRDFKRNIPSTPTLRSYQYQHRIRTKPGDVESIQKMLANLPEKRARRAINFDEIKTRSQATIHSNRLLRKRFKSTFTQNFLKMKNLQQKRHVKPAKKGESSRSTTDTSSESTPIGSPKHKNKGNEGLQLVKHVNSKEEPSALSNEAEGKIIKKKNMKKKEIVQKVEENPKIKTEKVKSKKLKPATKVDGYVVPVNGNKPRKKLTVIKVEPMDECKLSNSNQSKNKNQINISKMTKKSKKKVNMPNDVQIKTEVISKPEVTTALNQEVKEPPKAVLKNVKPEENSCDQGSKKKKSQTVKVSNVLSLKQNNKGKPDLLKLIKKKYKKSKKLLKSKKVKKIDKGSRRSLRLKSLQRLEESSDCCQLLLVKEENNFEKDIKLENPIVNNENVTAKKLVISPENSVVKKAVAINENIIVKNPVANSENLIVKKPVANAENLIVKKLVASTENLIVKKPVVSTEIAVIKKPVKLPTNKNIKTDDQVENKEIKLVEENLGRRSSRSLRNSIEEKLTNESNSGSAEKISVSRRNSRTPIDIAESDTPGQVENAERPKKSRIQNVRKMKNSKSEMVNGRITTPKKNITPNRRISRGAAKLEGTADTEKLGLRLSNDLEEMPILAKVVPIRGKTSGKNEKEIPILSPVKDQIKNSEMELQSTNTDIVSFQVIKKRKTASNEVTPLKIVKKVKSMPAEKLTKLQKAFPIELFDSNVTPEIGKAKKKRPRVAPSLKVSKKKTKADVKKYFLGICPSEIDKGRKGLAQEKEIKGLVQEKEIKDLAQEKEICPSKIDEGRKVLAQEKEIKGLTQEKEIKGLAQEKERKGLAQEKEIKGLAQEKEIKGLAQEKEILGLAQEKEIKGWAQEKERKGLAQEKERKGLAQEKERKGLAQEKERKENEKKDFQEENKRKDGPEKSEIIDLKKENKDLQDKIETIILPEKIEKDLPSEVSEKVQTEENLNKDLADESGSDSEPLISLVSAQSKKENKNVDFGVEKEKTVLVEMKEKKTLSTKIIEKQKPLKKPKKKKKKNVVNEIKSLAQETMNSLLKLNEMENKIKEPENLIRAKKLPFTETMKFGRKIKIKNRKKKKSAHKFTNRLLMTVTLKEPTLKIIEKPHCPPTENKWTVKAIEPITEIKPSPVLLPKEEETKPTINKETILPERRSRRVSKEIKTSNEFIIDDPLILVDELWSDLDSDSDSSKKKTKKGKKKLPKKKSNDDKKISDVNLEELLRNFGENKESNCSKSDELPLIGIKVIKKPISWAHSRKMVESFKECKSYKRLSLKLFRYNKIRKKFGYLGIKLVDAKRDFQQMQDKKQAKGDQIPDFPFLAAEIKENPIQVIQCGSQKPKASKRNIKKPNPKFHSNIHLKISLPLETINNMAVFNNNHLTQLVVEEAPNKIESLQEVVPQKVEKEITSQQELPVKEVQASQEEPLIPTEPVETNEMKNKTKRSEVIDKIFSCEICQTYYYSYSQLKIHKLSNRHKLKEAELQQASTETEVVESETIVLENVPPTEPAPVCENPRVESSEVEVIEAEKINEDTLEMPTLEGPFIENPPSRVALQPVEVAHQQPEFNCFGFSQESLKDIQRAIGCTDEEMLILTLLGDSTLKLENDILDLDSYQPAESVSEVLPSQKMDISGKEGEKTNGTLRPDLKQRMTSALASLVNKAVFNLLQKYQNAAKTTVNPEALPLLKKLLSLNRRKNILQLNELLKKQTATDGPYGTLFKDSEKKEPSVSYKYQCTICGSRFEKASTRECHINRSHKGKAKKATEEVKESPPLPEEDWYDTWSQNLGDDHINSSQFWCSDCGINFLSPKEVLDHQKSEHQAGPKNSECDKEAGPLQSSTIGSSDEIIEDKKRRRKPKVFSSAELDQQRIIANNELRKLDRKFLSKGKANKIKWGMDALKFTLEKEEKVPSIEEGKEVLVAEDDSSLDIKNIDLIPKLNLSRTSNIPEFKVIQKNALKNRFQKIMDNKLKRKSNQQQDATMNEVETEVMLVPVVIKKKSKKQKPDVFVKKNEDEKLLDIYDFNESESDIEPVVLSHVKKSSSSTKLKLVKVKEGPSKNKADSTTKDLTPDDYDSEDSLPLSVVKKSKPEDEVEEKVSEGGTEKKERILEQVEYLIEQLENETGTVKNKDAAKEENKKLSGADKKVTEYAKDETLKDFINIPHESSGNLSALDTENFPLESNLESINVSLDNERLEELGEQNESILAEAESSQSAFDDEDSMPLMMMAKKTDEIKSDQEKKCDENMTDISNSAGEDAQAFKTEKLKDKKIKSLTENTSVADESQPPEFFSSENEGEYSEKPKKIYENVNGNVIYCRNDSVSDFGSDSSHDGLINSNFERVPTKENYKNYIKEVTEKEDVVIVCSNGGAGDESNDSLSKLNQRRKKGNVECLQKKKKRFPLLTATIEENNFRKSESPKLNKEVIVKKIWSRRKVAEDSTGNDEDSLISMDRENSVELNRNEESQTEIEKEIIVKKIWSRKKVDVDDDFDKTEEVFKDMRINQTEISDEIVIKCGPKAKASPKRRKSKTSTNEASKETIMRKIWSGKCTVQTKAALKTYESDVVPNCKENDMLEQTKPKKRGRPSGFSSAKRNRANSEVDKSDEDDLDSLLEEIEREQLEKAIRLEFLHMRRSEKGNIEIMKEGSNPTIGLFTETSLKYKKEASEKKRKKVKKKINHPRQSLLNRKKFLKKPVRRVQPIEERNLTKIEERNDNENRGNSDSVVEQPEKNLLGKNEPVKLDPEIKIRKHKKHRHKHHHHKHKHKKSKHHKCVVSKHKSRHKSGSMDGVTETTDSFTILEKICQDIPNQIENEIHFQSKSSKRRSSPDLQNILSPFPFENNTKDCEDFEDGLSEKPQFDSGNGNIYEFVEDLPDFTPDGIRSLKM